MSSDAKDTDFTVKIIDVSPDGTAYNLDESIQRMRYRDGYDKPLVVDGDGQGLQGHAAAADDEQLFSRPDTGSGSRSASSNFPRFDRNLNTGGHNYDETTGVVAHNVVHHSAQYPSSVTITTVKRVQP